MTKEFSDAVRRATIDINQAGEYENDYKKLETVSNLNEVIKQINKMIGMLK